MHFSAQHAFRKVRTKQHCFTFWAAVANGIRWPGTNMAGCKVARLTLGLNLGLGLGGGGAASTCMCHDMLKACSIQQRQRAAGHSSTAVRHEQPQPHAQPLALQDGHGTATVTAVNITAVALGQKTEVCCRRPQVKHSGGRKCWVKVMDRQELSTDKRKGLQDPSSGLCWTFH